MRLFFVFMVSLFLLFSCGQEKSCGDYKKRAEHLQSSSWTLASAGLSVALGISAVMPPLGGAASALVVLMSYSTSEQAIQKEKEYVKCLRRKELEDFPPGRGDGRDRNDDDNDDGDG